MTKANEGGSVLSFVVIGAILVLTLVGGTYFVRQKLASVRADTKQQTSDTSTTKQPEKKDESKEPAKEEEPAKTPSTSQPVQPSNSPQDTSTTPPAALPQTGPIETLSVVLGLAFLTAASTAYLRSRRDYISL